MGVLVCPALGVMCWGEVVHVYTRKLCGGCVSVSSLGHQVFVMCLKGFFTCRRDKRQEGWCVFSSLMGDQFPLKIFLVSV